MNIFSYLDHEPLGTALFVYINFYRKNFIMYYFSFDKEVKSTSLLWVKNLLPKSCFHFRRMKSIKGTHWNITSAVFIKH